MKKLAIIAFAMTGFYSSAFATDNNKLLNDDGSYCYQTEYDLYNGTYTLSMRSKIYNCLSGNTFYVNNHGFKKLIAELRSNEDLPDPTLDPDGKEYKLQYFASVESLNTTMDTLNYNSMIVSYNQCESDNLNARNTFSIAMESYNKASMEYQKALSLYYKESREFSINYKNAQLIKEKLVKYNYNACMRGELLINGYPAPKIGCNVYAMAYTETDSIPEYNYYHHNELTILNKVGSTKPTSPNKPNQAIISDCVKPVKTIKEMGL